MQARRIVQRGAGRVDRDELLARQAQPEAGRAVVRELAADGDHEIGAFDERRERGVILHAGIPDDDPRQVLAEDAAP